MCVTVAQPSNMQAATFRRAWGKMRNSSRNVLPLVCLTNVGRSKFNPWGEAGSQGSFQINMRLTAQGWVVRMSSFRKKMTLNFTSDYFLLDGYRETWFRLKIKGKVCPHWLNNPAKEVCTSTSVYIRSVLSEGRGLEIRGGTNQPCPHQIAAV